MRGDTGEEWSVDRVRSVVAGLATGMAGTIGMHEQAAARLAAAAAFDGADAEALLIMRSTLIATRAVWEAAEAGPQAGEARQAIAAAKRLAIALP